jgi:site-specific DNA recombinase
MTSAIASTPRQPVRCAIYTRKSSGEGLDREYSSLDSQRDYCESYVQRHAANGWKALPTRYDDGGFSGGNTDRPALQRLFADIADGLVDLVIVYKIDRLSRSLLDFARMVELFDRKKVDFASATQPFNTTDSTSRLMLNVVLSFAQYEREIISERTRDKIAASRKRGIWWGGRPPLGYSIEPDSSKLVVVPDEAALLRTVFETYITTKSLERTAKLLNDRGARTKAWTYRDGRRVGGLPWDKPHVRLAITNVTCRGLVSHRSSAYEGTHERIIPETVWHQANEILAKNARSGADRAQPLRLGLLNGLLRCGPCGCAMSHTTAVRKSKCYRYYSCGRAARAGRDACRCPSVPAEQLEGFVLSKLRAMMHDRAVVDATCAALNGEPRDAEPVNRQGRRKDDRGPLDRSAAVGARQISPPAVGREVAVEILHDFDAAWGRLTAGERKKFVATLIRSIEWDGTTGKLTVTFEETGLETLARPGSEDCG